MLTSAIAYHLVQVQPRVDQEAPAVVDEEHRVSLGFRSVSSPGMRDTLRHDGLSAEAADDDLSSPILRVISPFRIALSGRAGLTELPVGWVRTVSQGFGGTCAVSVNAQRSVLDVIGQLHREYAGRN